ncbi:MAG: hypothetical protein Kow0047_32180 [Anaerolineae bacterium]
MSAIVLELLNLWRRARTATGAQIPVPPVEVYRAGNELEAEVIRGRLESEGIPVFLRREAAGPVFGLTVGALAEVRVLVPAPLADKALEILNTPATTDPEASDD